MNKRMLGVGTLVVSFSFIFIIITSNSSENQEWDFLKKPLPLKLRYKVGETLHYRLYRHNNHFKMDGSNAGEFKALAYYTRTRVENDNQGKVREKFIWKSFMAGQSMVPDQPAKMSYLKEAEDFSLTFSVEGEDVLNKFDFSSLPRTFEGLWFMIMVWDAITFDAPVRPQEHFKFPDKALIGTETYDTHEPWEFPIDFPPLVTDSKYFFSGKSYSRVIGVGLEKNIPCAIVEFPVLENKVYMNFYLKPAKVKASGFEHFWAKTYLSLEDGRIVKGELHGPILMVHDIWMGDQKEPTHDEYFVLQMLDLDLLSAKEFNSLVKEQKEMVSSKKK